MTTPQNRGSGAPIKVLIIDDSITIRRLLRLVLSADPEILVVGEAENPLEARELIKQTDPDILTLDVEMPKMDGLEFLKRLMRLRPMPVVMISTLTHKGSEAAVKALSLGAVDVFGKPQGPNVAEWQAITPVVKAAARAQVGRSSSKARSATTKSFGQWNGKVIAIGASTGGVDALETVLCQFPADCPPTLIVQHMPALFLDSLANRLDQKYGPRIRLAENGQTMEQGHVYIAPGGEHHLHVSKALGLELKAGEKVAGHRPSVDVLFKSLVPHGSNVVAALLTGMGRDGAESLGMLHRSGATTVAQDEATCVVYGMPRAAIEAGTVDIVSPIKDVADILLEQASSSKARRPHARMRN